MAAFSPIAAGAPRQGASGSGRGCAGCAGAAGANTTRSTRMPTAMIIAMEPSTSAMSPRVRPVSSIWPRPGPSAGDTAISSAAMSERQANAQPCSRPAR